MHSFRDALVDALGLRGDYDLRPHLSLLYRGGLGVEERGRLAATYRFDGEGVTFDEVALVRPAAGVATCLTFGDSTPASVSASSAQKDQP